MAIPAGKMLYRSLVWKGLQFLTSFLLNIILTRSFQSAISAEFYSLLYLLSLGICFFTLGLDISLNYYLARKAISPGMVRRIILGTVGLMLVVCLPLLRVAYHPATYPDLPLGRLLLFSACYLAGGLLTALSGTLFTAAGQNHLIGKVSFFFSGIMVGVSLAARGVYAGAALINHLFEVYFLFFLLQGACLFVLSMRPYRREAVEPGLLSGEVVPGMPGGVVVQGSAGALTGSGQVTIGGLLRFSSTAFVITFLFFAGSRLCIYLLPYRVALSEQGNYIQAYKIVEYMGLIISILYYPFIALVAGQEGKGMQQRVLLLVRISNSFVLLSALLLLACGNWLFPLVFGRSFDRLYTIFTGFLPGLFAVCSSTFFTAYYFGTGQLKYNLVSACIQLGAMGLFFFLFTKTGSATGAAWAFSGAAMASFGYDLWVFKNRYGLSVRDILLVRREDLRVIRMQVG